MGHRDPDLDELTAMLGRCLGRIDEQAFQLQRGDDEDDGAGDVLEAEAARLQELVGELLASAAPEGSERADLATTVERAVQGCLRELGFPVIVRHNLARDLGPVACQPGQLAYAVQRAVHLGTTHAGHGGEVAITTRANGDGVVFELEALGDRGDRHLVERTATLRDFVGEMNGRCHAQIAQDRRLLIAIELPCCLAPDDC